MHIPRSFDNILWYRLFGYIRIAKLMFIEVLFEISRVGTPFGRNGRPHATAVVISFALLSGALPRQPHHASFQELLRRRRKSEDGGLRESDGR